jgi:hypothetical protein
VSTLGRADDWLAVFEERLGHVERPEAAKAGDRDQHRRASAANNRTLEARRNQPTRDQRTHHRADPTDAH